MNTASTSRASSGSYPGTEQSLRSGRLGVIGIVFFVVAAASPLVGMTGALPAAILLGNGAAAPGAYLLAGLILLLFSVGYAAMSHQVTNSGAFFAYIGRGMGLHLGVGSAFVSLLAYLAIHLSIFGFFGGLMAEQVGGLPWWGWSLVAWAAVTWLSLRSVDVGAHVLGLLMGLELLSLVVTAVAIFVQGGPLRRPSARPTSWRVVWRVRPASRWRSRSPLSWASKPPPSTAKNRSTPSAPCRWPPTSLWC